MFAHCVSYGLLFVISLSYGNSLRWPRQANTIDDDDCECVAYFLCDENNTIKTGGEGIIDIRLKECSGDLEVCCKAPKESGQPTTDYPPVPVGRSGQCGVRNVGGIDGVAPLARIVSDGDTTSFGEFPWMTAILRVQPDNNVFVCGGSIIHPSVILTAAHCVRNININELKIRAGEWDTRSITESLPHQDRLVTRIAIHPKFHTTAMHNDIALLFLDAPLILDRHIDTICLPTEATMVNTSGCIATGWGKDAFGKEGKYQSVLKKVDLSLVPHSDCQTKLRTTRLSRFFKLDQSFVCAGGDVGRDTCKGDGGGPLICSRPGQPTSFIQIGIVSWGIGCGENSIPAVYGSVIYAIGWINEQLIAMSSNSVAI